MRARASLAVFAMCLSSAVVSAQDAELRADFVAGMRAYDAGQFEAALERFQRVYAASHDPDVLYNVATTLDRLRRDEDALAAYTQYAQERPSAQDLANVQGRIRVLRAAIEARRPAPPPPAVTPPPPPVSPPPPPPDLAPTRPPARPQPAAAGGPGAGPWIVAGAGAALAITGGVLLVLAQSDVSTVEDGTRWADIRDAYDRAPTFSTAGAILVGVGGAAIAGGFAWAIFGGRSGADARDVAVAVTPGGVVVRGAF